MKKKQQKLNDKLTLFYEEYKSNNQELFDNDEFAKKMYQAIQAGDKEVYQKNIAETKIFDENWIETLESYFPSLDQIVRNPKSTIKYENEIVPIEKAKKTDSLSIRHLSANTHLIKEVDGDQIRPKKILTTYSDIDYATYENRMVSSLIQRLFYFVRSRYEVIKEFGDSFQQKALYFKADFPFNKGELSFDLKLNVKEELDNQEINEYNKRLLNRVERLEKLVSGFMGSNFMKDLKNTPRVRTPIMKTIVIQKNVHYKNCYMLWLFLDRYNTLAYETEIQEKEMKLDKDYLNSVYQDVITNLTSILYHQEKRKLEYNEFDKIKRKKAVKVIKDIEINPLLEEEFEIEDNNINQYYLEQSKKLFRQSLEYHEATSSTYEVALKRALRETIEFSNQLYHDFFEFEKEDDIFKRLISQMNPKDELAQIRKMSEIAKAIREVKEVDYRRIVAMERRLLTRIGELDKVLLKSAERGLESLIVMQKMESQLTSEQERSAFEAENLKQELEISKTYQQELDELRKNINQSFRAIEREYRKKETDAVREVKAEFRQLHRLAINNEKARHLTVLNELEVNKEQTINQMQEDFIKMQDDLIKEYQEKLRLEGILVNEDFETELKELRKIQAVEVSGSEDEHRKDIYQVSLDLGAKRQDLIKELEEYSDLMRQKYQVQSKNPVRRKVERQRIKSLYD